MAKNFNLEIIKSKTGQFQLNCKKIKQYRVNIYYLCNSRPLNNCYMKEMSQNDLKLEAVNVHMARLYGVTN